MIDVLVIVNSKEDLKAIDNLTLNKEPFWCTIDQRDPHMKSKAYKIKSSYGAKEVPFAVINVDGKVDKVFYSEDNINVLQSLEAYINDIKSA